MDVVGRGGAELTTEVVVGAGDRLTIRVGHRTRLITLRVIGDGRGITQGVDQFDRQPIIIIVFDAINRGL